MQGSSLSLGSPHNHAKGTVGMTHVAVCAAGLDKNMWNCWVCFWLMAFWETREVLGLVGKQGSEQKCCECPQRWNIVNKGLFLPMLIIGSGTKPPRGQSRLLGYKRTYNHHKIIRLILPIIL